MTNINNTHSPTGLSSPVRIILLIAGMLLGLATLLFLFATDTYYGAIVLRTQDDRTAFEEAVSRPEVFIRSIRTAYTSPDIISFEVQVPAFDTFPYGRKAIWKYVGVALLAAPGLWGLLATWRRRYELA